MMGKFYLIPPGFEQEMCDLEAKPVVYRMLRKRSLATEVTDRFLLTRLVILKTEFDTFSEFYASSRKRQYS